MGADNWNISKIVIEDLKNIVNMSYAQIASAIGCTEQALLDWRKGTRRPRKAHIEDICKAIPHLLENEEAEQKYLSILKNKFSVAGGKVNIAMESCNSVNSLLNYLYENFEKDTGADKLYNLFNDDSNNALLKEIFIRKLQLNKDDTLFFQL